MGEREVRIGQLIAPFGPGSLYTDRRGTPLIVCGLDHWYKVERDGDVRSCDDPGQFDLVETRLAALLNIPSFRLPPDHRWVSRREQPPPNAFIKVPSLRFPRWYRHSATGRMHRFSMELAKLPKPDGGGRWIAVRFVAVCERGHLCDFPWRQWIGCTCGDGGQLVLDDRGGTDLTSVSVGCEGCNRRKNLGNTMSRPAADSTDRTAFERAGITCPGDRPWLGEGGTEAGCSGRLTAALINQTNLHFARTSVAITLPDLGLDEGALPARNAIEADARLLISVASMWKLGQRDHGVMLAVAALREKGLEVSGDIACAAIESLLNPGPTGNARRAAAQEDDLVLFRRQEFDVLREGIDDRKRSPNLRIIRGVVPDVLSEWIARVNLVERLRETRAFVGFDRVSQGRWSPAGTAAQAVQQLFLRPPDETSRWLPAVQVFGEGIYVELSEERINRWLDEQHDWLERRLDGGLVARLGAEPLTQAPLGGSRRWAARYLLVHSLAHVLVNQLVFECGYGNASLRERLYVSDDRAAPMAGFLIYTAAGDSEGTLGGLVRTGQPDRLGPAMIRAVGRASWCSADPVCSENLGGQGSRRLNLAACHACALLPETTCETVNHGLDRAMVVGTPRDRFKGFMSAVLEDLHELG